MTSKIPIELLEDIRKRLNTSLEVYRFRAVCKSWRSSVPPFKNQLQFPIQFKGPKWRNYTLTENVFYRITYPSNHACKKSWLTKVTQAEFGKTHILHPFCQSKIKFPKTYPRIFNLLKHREFELAKEYHLARNNKAIRCTDYKVAVSINLDFPAVMIVMDRRLYHGKLGAGNKVCLERLTLSRSYGQNDYWYFLDVIFYQGKFYVVSGDGKLAVIDSSMNYRVFESRLDPSRNNYKHRHLVEAFGELLLVDIKSTSRPLNHPSAQKKIKSVDQVYKLNADMEHWIKLEKEAIADLIFILGDNSFLCVSAQDFPGCKGNTIYYWKRKEYWTTPDGETCEFDEMVSEIKLHRDHDCLPLETIYASAENIFNPGLVVKVNNKTASRSSKKK